MIDKETPNLWEAIIQSFAKTFTMMLGEVEADSIIGRKRWPVNLFLVSFEVIAGILLINLLVNSRYQ